MNKKIRNMYLTLSSFLLSYLLFFPVNVYASSTSDAVADIMNSDRFSGAISSIEWLTTRVDYWFTMVITAAGFFIISAALLKNACAGAYCANHKFWDKVAEAHEKNESMQLSQLFSGMKDKIMNISTSGIKDAILCIVPNIKAFTDFDDADIEPKQYFMKAIPQMLGCIIIGVFIYNGYYRDTAASVGNFGSEICSRVFSSVDPATWVDKLTQTTGTPPSIYENDQTLEGKALLQVTKALYKVYLSNTPNLTSTEDKTALMRDCEVNASKVLQKTSEKTTKPDGTQGVEVSTFQTKFFSDTRTFDYSLTNLKIVPGPSESLVSAKNTLVLNKLDKDKDGDYAASGYYDFTSKIITSNMTSTDNTSFRITFVMKAGQKTSATGMSTLSASAGSWNDTTADLVTISNLPATEYKENSKGSHTVRVVNFTNQIVQSSQVKDAAQKKIMDIDKSAKNITFVDASVSNYPGQGGTLVTSNATGNTFECSVDVRYTLSYTDESGSSKSTSVVVPVNVTITK